LLPILSSAITKRLVAAVPCPEPERRSHLLLPAKKARSITMRLDALGIDVSCGFPPPL